MTKVILTLLFIALPLLRAEFAEIPNPKKDYQFKEIENPHKDYRAKEPRRAPANFPAAANLNIDKCVEGAQALKPVFNKLIVDSNSLSNHDNLVRDFKILSIQLQEVSTTCGFSIATVGGEGVAANCEDDAKDVSAIAKTLLADTDNYLILITHLMALGQILPQAILDCSI